MQHASLETVPSIGRQGGSRDQADQYLLQGVHHMGGLMTTRPDLFVLAGVQFSSSRFSIVTRPLRPACSTLGQSSTHSIGIAIIALDRRELRKPYVPAGFGFV